MPSSLMIDPCPSPSEMLAFTGLSRSTRKVSVPSTFRSPFTWTVMVPEVAPGAIDSAVESETKSLSAAVAVPSTVFQITSTCSVQGPERRTGKLKSVVPAFPSTSITSPTERLQSAAKEAAMVWFAETALNVKFVTAPCETPSASTSTTWKQGLGVMVKAWLPPEGTTTAPLGLIVPPVPAEAVIVKLTAAKVAEIVWAAVTFVKLKEAIAPCETPSTSTLEMANPEFAAIMNPWLAPQFTTTEPDVVMAPPDAAQAYIR